MVLGQRSLPFLLRGRFPLHGLYVQWITKGWFQAEPDGFFGALLLAEAAAHAFLEIHHGLVGLLIHGNGLEAAHLRAIPAAIAGIGHIRSIARGGNEGVVV